MFFFLTQFLQDVLGYSPLTTGLAFLPLTVMLFTASQLSARVLTGRLRPQTVMVGGLMFSTLGLLWLSQLHAEQQLPGAAGPLCCSASATAWRSCR